MARYIRLLFLCTDVQHFYDEPICDRRHLPGSLFEAPVFLRHSRKEDIIDIPAKQSLYGIVEVFFDTIVICTFTALVILTSGVGDIVASGGIAVTETLYSAAA